LKLASYGAGGEETGEGGGEGGGEEDGGAGGEGGGEDGGAGGEGGGEDGGEEGDKKDDDGSGDNVLYLVPNSQTNSKLKDAAPNIAVIANNLGMFNVPSFVFNIG